MGILQRIGRALVVLGEPDDVRTAVDVAQQRSVLGNAAGLPPDTGNNLIDTTPQRKFSGVVPLRGEAPTVYQPTGTTVRVQGFERHPIVSACIREIDKVFSAVPLQAVRRKDPTNPHDVDPLGTDHPLQRLVDFPSPFLSSQRLRSFLGTHFLTYGNALWFIERGEAQVGLPTGLRVVQPEDLSTVYANAQGYAIWYMWRDVLGYSHTSPVTDMMHFRDMSVRSMIFGYPRAASAINDIIGDREASEYVREVVTNHGYVGAIAIANEETTVDEAAAAEAMFNETVVGRGNRGRTKFIGGVKDVKSVSFDLRELEFPDLRRIAREDICAAFGVDPRMVSVSSAASDAGLSGEQYREARRRLIQQTVEPMMRLVESELNLWLAPEYGDVYLRFDPDVLSALVEDNKETSERLRAEVGAGLATIEEARVVLGRPAEYETDHTLGLASGIQVVPVALAGAEAENSVAAGEAAAKALASGATPANGDGSTPSKEPQAIASKSSADDDSARSEADAQAVLAERVFTRSIVLSTDQRNLIWRAFEERAIREEAPFRRAAAMLFSEERATVARIFARQADTVPNDARAVGKIKKQSHEEGAVRTAERQIKAMYRGGGEVELRWIDRFHSLIGATYSKGATGVAQSLERSEQRASRPAAKGLPKAGELSKYDYHIEAPGVQQAIRARAKRLAEHVGKTTGRNISNVIRIGLSEGMGTREIAKLIDKAVFGGDAGYRATMIARTESIGALNQGEYDTAVDSGDVEGKEWLTQNDSDVRDTHLLCEAEGMIPVSEQFVTNGMLHPGDQAGSADEVINCRCTLLYYSALDAGASSVYTGKKGTAPKLKRSEQIVIEQPVPVGVITKAARPFTILRSDGGEIIGVQFVDRDGTPGPDARPANTYVLRRNNAGSIIGADRFDAPQAAVTHRTVLDRDSSGHVTTSPDT